MGSQSLFCRRTCVILLNFAHPLTDDHRAQLAALAGRPMDRVLDVPVHIDETRPLAEQAADVLDQAGLTPREWQTQPLLVNLPGYAPAAAALLAELHGRMGHFPTIVRLRPVQNSPVTHYEVAEIVNLQAVRDAARRKRADEKAD